MTIEINSLIRLIVWKDHYLVRVKTGRKHFFVHFSEFIKENNALIMFTKTV